MTPRAFLGQHGGLRIQNPCFLPNLCPTLHNTPTRAQKPIQCWKTVLGNMRLAAANEERKNYKETRSENWQIFPPAPAFNEWGCRGGLVAKRSTRPLGVCPSLAAREAFAETPRSGRWPSARRGQGKWLRGRRPRGSVSTVPGSRGSLSRVQERIDPGREGGGP